MTDVHSSRLRRAIREPQKAARFLRRRAAASVRASLGMGFIRLVYRMKRLWRRDLVVVSPTPPSSHKYMLWKLARLAGIELVSETTWRPGGRPPLAFVRHLDATWDPDADPTHVNGRCVDISKTRVDEVFESVFGYATRLDPTTFVGTAVVKSEVNYDGKGAFVDCPIAPDAVRARHIYQKLVDNEVSAGVVREYRVGIVGGRIADVMVADRAVENRLLGRGSGAGRGSAIRDVTEVFSDSEVERIEEFCRRLGLDLGELDVLPDVHERRSYILDANKTPTSLVSPTAIRPSRLLLLMRRAERFRRYLHERRTAAADSRAADLADRRHLPRTG